MSTTSPDSAVGSSAGDAGADALVDLACQLLRQFTCVPSASPDGMPTPPAVDPALVRQAVLVVADHSDYQILGICADGVAAAEAALTGYGRSLGYDLSPLLPLAQHNPAAASITGPLYVKYNPKLGRCHVDRYIGEHRGVLVSCQSAYDGDINETFGHLPLDLFTETTPTP
jgi:Domain of unknown function (DUF1824)